QEVARPGALVPPERRRVGMVFQDYALFPHLDVATNIAYGLARGSNRPARVAELLHLVGLDGLERRMPHQLSGGQQQRVALARALAPHPAAILLDEPFSNLDAGLRAEVRADVRDILRRAGATAVFVTHDQEEALSIADVV
ncbi:MAG TPA: ATP-binding cassette domain-containing protein, partial [Roseiflexaceae bacterium]|nr:ATP-binding cassette domain-containing protein [Roseiflexaceae bacterium]